MFSLISNEEFNKTVKAFLRHHFAKERHAAADFHKFFDGKIEQLKIDPRMLYPERQYQTMNVSIPGLTWMKCRWNYAPLREYSARKVRLVYAYSEAQMTVYPLHLYSHSQYSPVPNMDRAAKVLLDRVRTQ